MRGIVPFFKVLFSVIIIIAVSAGCSKRDDDSLVPSYIRIDRMGLSTTYEQGTASHRISDVWVYVDETLIGAFELPATVPILAEGLQRVTIRPGIKMNGIASTRTIYPYFNPIVKTLNLVRDSVIVITDTITAYRSNVYFPWMEGFELNSYSMEITSKSTVGFGKTGDPSQKFILPGEINEYSAYFHLPADTSIFELITKESFEFPSAGSEVFLEMNYKTDNVLVVGVHYLATGILVQRPLLYLHPSDKWNKVYVNLTVPKYDTPNATDFRIFVGAQTESGREEANLYLDNLKLIHFKTSK